LDTQLLGVESLFVSVALELFLSTKVRDRAAFIGNEVELLEFHRYEVESVGIVSEGHVCLKIKCLILH
jgi:hypothetical protein